MDDKKKLGKKHVEECGKECEKGMPCGYAPNHYHVQAKKSFCTCPCIVFDGGIWHGGTMPQLLPCASEKVFLLPCIVFDGGGVWHGGTVLGWHNLLSGLLGWHKKGWISFSMIFSSFVILPGGRYWVPLNLLLNTHICILEQGLCWSCHPLLMITHTKHTPLLSLSGGLLPPNVQDQISRIASLIKCSHTLPGFASLFWKVVLFVWWCLGCREAG